MKIRNYQIKNVPDKIVECEIHKTGYCTCDDEKLPHKAHVIFRNGPPGTFNKITVSKNEIAPAGKTSDKNVLIREPSLYEFFGDRPVIYLKKLRKYAITVEE